jgi:hypothetical protein
VLCCQELRGLHEEVEASRLYTEAQRSRVLANLHAMAKNVARLRNDTSAATAANLREALKIRLTILSDNVHGFISAADVRAARTPRTRERWQWRERRVCS